MRDHRKLVAFEKADALVLDVYRASATLPATENFGLKAQIRRSAVSVASNLVEGCARESEVEFLRFISIAQASAKELAYQVSVAVRLQMFPVAESECLTQQCEECVRIIAGLRRSLAKTDT